MSQYHPLQITTEPLDGWLSDRATLHAGTARHWHVYYNPFVRVPPCHTHMRYLTAEAN